MQLNLFGAGLCFGFSLGALAGFMDPLKNGCQTMIVMLAFGILGLLFLIFLIQGGVDK